MHNETEYDPDTLRRFSARLRRRALFVMVLWPVIGVLAGAYAGQEIAGGLSAAIGGAVGAFIGYLIGSMRFLYYHVQAMNMLCLRRIEENTRSA